MTIFNVTHTYAILIPFALAACATGGDDPVPANVQPQAASGFAQPGDFIGPDTSFTARGVNRLVNDNVGARRERQNITVSLLAGGVVTRVVIDGQTYDLPIDGAGFRLVQPNGDEISFQQLTLTAPGGGPLGQGVVEAARLTFLSNDLLNTGVVAYGFDTDPADVDARSNPTIGNVTYSGRIEVRAYQQNGVALSEGSGAGTFGLIADFDDNQVTGGFDIADTGGTDPIVPTANFELLTGNISGNGFSGTFIQTPVGDPLVLSEATYTGRFYGADAEAAAGDVSATITPDTGAPILLEGVFIADELLP